MYVVTSEQMRKIDEYTIRDIGIPAAVLMENAGRAAADEIASFTSQETPQIRKPWIVLVGKGNNGGDGIVAARHLSQKGIDAELLYAALSDSLSCDAALQRDIAERLSIPSSIYVQGEVHWDRYGGIVDALLGTGTKGSPREPYASLIREANDSGLPIIALDVPSGLNADTGEVYVPCICAKRTVTFAFTKVGLTQFPGAEVAGHVTVAPIGIPDAAASQFKVKTRLSSKKTFKKIFGLDWPLPRGDNTHKGTYGHALLVAGSKAYSGAGLLAAKAVLRAGAGLVTWVMPNHLLNTVTGRLPEAILYGAADDGNGHVSVDSADEIVKLAAGKRVIAVGPGLGRFDGEAKWLRRIWDQADCPLVLDADALNILAECGGLDLWPKRLAPVVLTPHPGEMARLAKLSNHEVQRDRVALARTFAQQYGVILVLKGARTVIAMPDGHVCINMTGNPGMAVGGSGDVLTGIIASLIAQGLSPSAAAVIGVHAHGEAGDRALTLRTSPASLLAGDIIEAL
ncbi:NAD(P)H-hydrate dehydratase [Marinicrinis lubricantis]|uniref:Bifunctional NAD(P)H-hydrate repair enzyme n=1 Tax=Marinicrinis lubricantis TaxID=2086470 RepID=A0ABW1IQ39_9BACL